MVNHNQMHGACINGDLSKVKRLVKNGFDITINNNYAVRLASEYGHLEVVKYLVSKGADITARDNYAVRYASAFGQFEVVKYLFILGADHNNTVRTASYYGRIEIVKYLKQQLNKTTILRRNLLINKSLLFNSIITNLIVAKL